jgi:sterol desaturase/sphingolipid hydroxylase (fatty acid hydroxylase superfamily)
VVRHTFLVIPFLVLAVEAPTIIPPQSHRVHHSIEGRHRDTNFGSLFSM